VHLAVRGRDLDAELARDEDLEIHAPVTVPLARDLALEGEYAAQLRIDDADLLEQIGGSLRRLGARRLADLDLDLVAVLSSDTGLAVRILDAQDAASRRREVQRVDALYAFAPGNAGE
jgi:hypothetical protein